MTSLHCVCVCVLLGWLDLAVTINFKSANFTCTCTNSTNSTNHLATCSTNNGDKTTETTRGHWLEHHEDSSSLATLTKLVDLHVAPWLVTLLLGLLQLANYQASLTHSSCDVHEYMFQECHNFCAHCPVTFCM